MASKQPRSAQAHAHAQRQTKCRLAEIIQYNCDAELTRSGSQFHCWPIPRIFRICPGRPAVEMTRFVEVDTDTGAVRAPSESSGVLPKGKPWRDVVRYEKTTVEEP